MSAKLCSRNEHKLTELRRVLPDWRLHLLEAAEYPPEVGETYYENARAKARFGRRLGDSDLLMLGEDSGIEVVGLGGRPGVHSARWSDHPVEALLTALRAVTGEGRRARYVCELVALTAELEEFRGTGVLAGRIAKVARGSQGFGYDPVFIADGEERTVGELGADWKSEHSHRAHAARELLAAL